MTSPISTPLGESEMPSGQVGADGWVLSKDFDWLKHDGQVVRYILGSGPCVGLIMGVIFARSDGLWIKRGDSMFRPHMTKAVRLERPTPSLREIYAAAYPEGKNTNPPNLNQETE